MDHTGTGGRAQADGGVSQYTVHDYQSLHLPIVVSIITRHLNDFLAYSETLLRHDIRMKDEE